LGQVEERRDALRLKQAEEEATTPGHNKMMKSIQEVLLLLKILLGVMVVLFAMLILKK
jgi:hypothetical protein